MPHFTSLHWWCTHWMQHYAAPSKQNSSCDWWYNEINHCSYWAAYFLYSLLFPDADLSFFFPVHFICLFIFCSIHPCVCWCVGPGVTFCVRVPAVFRLQYPRCVCTFPRRWSCCRGRGPCCWCIWWIWWVTKQLSVQTCVHGGTSACANVKAVAFIILIKLLLLS